MLQDVGIFVRSTDRNANTAAGTLPITDGCKRALTNGWKIKERHRERAALLKNKQKLIP